MSKGSSVVKDAQGDTGALGVTGPLPSTQVRGGGGLYIMRVVCSKKQELASPLSSQ